VSVTGSRSTRRTAAVGFNDHASNCRPVGIGEVMRAAGSVRSSRTKNKSDL